MMISRCLLIAFICASCLVITASGVLTADEERPEPHENPASAEITFDDVAILEYHTELLEHVLSRSPDQAEFLRDKGPFANVPESLRDSINDFGQASVDLATLVVEIEGDLEELNTLASQFLLQEMNTVKESTNTKLYQAFADLLDIQDNAEVAREELGVPPPENRGPLRRAYDTLEERIDQLRGLLELLQELLNAVPGTPLEDILRQLEPGTPLEDILGQLLHPTEVTLYVEPLSEFVGEWVRVEGILRSGTTYLENRTVVILLDGAPYQELKTGAKGIYQGQIQLPYRYDPAITLQSLYYPRGEDVGSYLASKSQGIEIRLLFYTADLSLEISGKSYPGMKTVVEGSFDYGDDPAPETREIEMYLDQTLVGEVNIPANFELAIGLPPDIPPGEHRLALVAPAEKRYAPVSGEVAFKVVKLVPVVDMSPPGIALMPLALNVKGRVYSDLGPLEGVPVEATFGNHKARGTTSGDGTFSLRVSTGLNFSLVGSEKLSVEVFPQDPWYAAGGSTKTKLITANLVTICVMALGLIILGLLSIRRIKAWLADRRLQRAEKRPISGYGPATEKPGEKKPPVTAIERTEMEGIQLIFELYRGILKLIQNLTGSVLRPNMTFREFIRQNASQVGPAYRHLDRLTRLIEKFLYSRHSPDPAELDESRELARLTEEAIRHERS